MYIYILYVTVLFESGHNFLYNTLSLVSGSVSLMKDHMIMTLMSSNLTSWLVVIIYQLDIECLYVAFFPNVSLFFLYIMFHTQSMHCTPLEYDHKN